MGKKRGPLCSVDGPFLEDHLSDTTTLINLFVFTYFQDPFRMPQAVKEIQECEYLLLACSDFAVCVCCGWFVFPFQP